MAGAGGECRGYSSPYNTRPSNDWGAWARIRFRGRVRFRARVRFRFRVRFRARVRIGIGLG